MYSLSSRWEGSHTTSTMNSRSAPSKAAPASKKSSKPQPGRSQRTAKLSQSGPLSAAPVSQQRVTRTPNPQFEGMRNGDCRITHREYIGEINASTGSPSAFASGSFVINPAQSASFPWLSTIAARYESYRFEKLRFCYETEAPSSLGGSLVMTVDYDASDPAPLSKQQAMAYRGAVRSAPWEECSHTSTPEDLRKRQSYFCRPGAVPANADVKLYDTGNLFVCTQNVSTASAVCGELYVEYSVILMTPVYEIALAAFSGSASVGLTAAAPLGTNFVAASGNNLVASPNAAGTVLTVTGLVIGQEYMLVWNIGGSGISALDVALVSGASAVTGSLVINSASTAGVRFRTFTATASTLVLTFGVAATTVTLSTVYMAMIPSYNGL